MQEQSTPIHISLDDPRRGRPKVFCGAKLRVGHAYSLHEYHVELGARVMVAILVRTGHNNRTTRFVTRGQYYEDVCPRCLESDDYSLALLGALP